MRHGVPGEQPKPARRTALLDPLEALGDDGPASTAISAFFSPYTFFTVPAFTPFVLDMTPYRAGAVFFAWGVLFAGSSVLVAPRLQKRFGSLKVLGGSLAPLAADVLLLGYGGHTTAVVCTVLSGAFIGVNNTVHTELALGVSDAPRPVASTGYNFVRWFAAAAAPFFAPRIEEWTDIHVPFVVAAVTAVLGAVVVLVRREALTAQAEDLELTAQAEDLESTRATEEGVAVFADRRALPADR